MDQRLHLETPGRRAIDFNGSLLSDDEVERQLARVRRTPLSRRDREYPFCEVLITDDAGVVDLQLPNLAKVSSLSATGWEILARGAVAGTVLPN